MKPNIFQKIAFLVYISIILMICIYFVPFYYNHGISYSNILSQEYGEMKYFRFLIYIIIPTLFFYFVYKYLEEMNSLDLITFKIKAKKELYIFFIFISIIIGTLLFLNGKNEYSEIKKNALENKITETDNELNKAYQYFQNNFNLEVLREVQNDNFIPPTDGTVAKRKRPPLYLTSANKILRESKNSSISISLPLPKQYKLLPTKENIDKVLLDYFATIKAKPNLSDKEFLQKFPEFNNKLSVLNSVKNYYKNHKKIDTYKDQLNKLVFYNSIEIKNNIVFIFFASFILLYIVRPLFSILKGMLKEVN